MSNEVAKLTKKKKKGLAKIYYLRTKNLAENHHEENCPTDCSKAEDHPQKNNKQNSVFYYKNKERLFGFVQKIMFLNLTELPWLKDVKF